MHRTLFTIGYEGAEISQFLETLRECGIQHVIDIRDVPVSRKRGFSKTPLAAELALSGIGYSHLKALGDPKPGRDAMRRSDYAAFLKVYESHIATDAAQAALHEAVNLAKKNASVLLCFERSPKECHRTIVAAEMSQIALFEIRNVGVSAQSRSLKNVQTGAATLAHLAI
ncbi:DUF488 domain-containing protein [Sphingomonas sp. Leaf357]|uniref:DUF488 domain-containing protein n=1 Tax=Sphingomonas sp. Leaf357 TaxID=1736350 RepID=UPI0009EBDDBD|nr:DUF488 domain-containing protein [Sphingomonas sp. Leaf357]